MSTTHIAATLPQAAAALQWLWLRTSAWRPWLAVAGLCTPAADTPQEAAAREAAPVRALADQYRRSDPGFASDLYAAADRYERSFDA
jgi:hypothetical protein